MYFRGGLSFKGPGRNDLLEFGFVKQEFEFISACDFVQRVKT